MSDFLINLAARTVGTPALRPRLRSRFEPAPLADAGVAFEATMPGLSPGRAGVVEGIPESPRKATIDAVPAPPSLPTPARTSLPLPHKTNQRTDDDPISAPAPAPAAAAVTSPPAVPPPRRTTIDAPAAVPPTRSTPAPERVVTESIVETRDIIVREPALPAVASATATSPAPVRHRYDEQPPRIERTVVSRETHFATATPRSTRVAQPRMEVPPVSEPVIQVSIGRVEVRAVAPPPAVKQHRTARPAMTIDDYAARRNAKGRR